MARILLVIAFLVMPLLLAAEDIHQWDSISRIHSGQKIVVTNSDGTVRDGEFISYTPESLVMKTLTVKRAEVLRVSIQQKSHRLRNALIFGAAGMILGSFAHDAQKEATVPIGFAAGAALGALWPTGKTKIVYQATVMTRVSPSAASRSRLPALRLGMNIVRLRSWKMSGC